LHSKISNLYIPCVKSYCNYSNATEPTPAQHIFTLTSTYLYMILVLLISHGSSKNTSLKSEILPISFKQINLQTTAYMNLIICWIYPCASILFKMRLDGSDVRWRYDVRTTAALVVIYVFCASFEPFIQHIDRVFYKFRFPICVQKCLNSFLFHKYIFNTKFDSRPLSATYFNP